MRLTFLFYAIVLTHSYSCHNNSKTDYPKDIYNKSLIKVDTIRKGLNILVDNNNKAN